MPRFKAIIVVILLVAIFGCGRITSSSGSGGGGGSSGSSGNSSAPIINSIRIFPNNITAPGDIDFSAQIIDPDSVTANFRYVWDFGDGVTDNAAAPTHRYPYQGEFYVSLLVYDQQGNYDYKVSETKVKIIGGNRKPVINSCQADIITANIGDSIDFSSNCTDPDLDTLTYAWDFGDGNTSALQNDSHTYLENGVYSVKFTVTDPSGASAGKELLVGIGPNIKLPPLINAIEWEPYFPLENVNVTFSAQIVDYDGTIISHYWEFGDGGTSSLTSPQHIYLSAGTYQLKLTVQDDQGLVKILEKYISVGIGE